MSTYACREMGRYAPAHAPVHECICACMRLCPTARLAEATAHTPPPTPHPCPCLAASMPRQRTAEEEPDATAEQWLMLHPSKWTVEEESAYATPPLCNNGRAPSQGGQEVENEACQ